MTVTIAFPLTGEQAKAVVVAADALCVEPWEIAVSALNFRRDVESAARRAPAVPEGEEAP